MNKLLTLLLIISTANAFTLPKPTVSNWKYVGDTKPIGYFDPLLLFAKGNCNTGVLLCYLFCL